MSEQTVPAGRMSRRRLLAAGAGVAGSAVILAAGGLAGTAVAAPRRSAAEPRPTRWTRATSANGWPILDAVSHWRIEGSDVDVPVQDAAAPLLLYVARRFHYEIDELRTGEVLGHTTDRAVIAEYESDYLSGSAIAIRPKAYPAGVGGGLFPQELAVVRDILTDLEGVVGWGGDEDLPKESHFHIATGPDDPALNRVTDKMRYWNTTPGKGAGAAEL
ncbi:hypothetical protein [Amycolatopsis aidingensis]|uniref:hypothetical protein n=1 Tax=Amycolatopsis aidingensis TaxID=2842453 RepID=UPI001C0D3816|nr:hypothetical protein [Amycolatopsis aidingensis]